MEKPVITRRSDGEYSTIRLPDGSIETAWCPNNLNAPIQVIGRTYPQTLPGVAERHITNWEGNH